MTLQESTKIFKALSDETRAKIFELLRGGSMCACKLQESFDITQPTLSHHMKTLCDSGIVTARKDGKWTYYAIDCAKLEELIEYIGDTACRKGKNIKKSCKKCSQK